MPSPQVSLSIDGRLITLTADSFTGAVDHGAVTKEGVVVSGWGLTRTEIEQQLPPALFIVAVGDHVCAVAPPNLSRPDVAAKFGSAALRCGFSITVMLSAIPPPFIADLTVYAVSDLQIATPLPQFKPGDLVNLPVIRSGGDFMRLIQTPSTRIKSSQTIAYTALHALTRFPSDFSVRSGALCVIGYRLVAHEIDDPEIRAIFWREARKTLDAKHDLSTGVYLRWHTSVRLVCGYLSYQAGERSEAIAHFSVIGSLSHLLSEWPTALTNILLGIFLTGYLLYEDGDSRRASEVWSHASDLLKHGSAISNFSNVYAYGELENAVRVARECYVGILVAEAGGPLQDASVAPPGRTVDLRGLGIIARIVHEKAVAR